MGVRVSLGAFLSSNPLSLISPGASRGAFDAWDHDGTLRPTAGDWRADMMNVKESTFWAEFHAISRASGIWHWTSDSRVDSLGSSSFCEVSAPMALLFSFKRVLKGIFVPAVFLAVSGYFAWHAVHGERGLMARDKREADITAARAELRRAEADRDAMERRVAGLRGDRLDRDQLEERARSLLNMVGRDEVIVPYGPERRLY
jgi:cell division protein FtsB